jgi:hypothetical protein
MDAMGKDHRKWRRHWVGEGEYKIFIPNHSLIGSVLDVGNGGLSFEYMPCYSIIGEGSELDVYFHDGYRLHVPPVGCRIIYDRPDRSKGSYYRIFEIRRAGAEFVPGDEGITASLRQLIDGQDEGRLSTGVKRAENEFYDMPRVPLKISR